jgi:hypothetical protein
MLNILQKFSKRKYICFIIGWALVLFSIFTFSYLLVKIFMFNQFIENAPPAHTHYRSDIID